MSNGSTSRPGPRGGNAGGPPPKTGLSRFPNYLRQDLGLPDWLAGIVVILLAGLALVLFCYMLILIFPAK